MPYTDAELFNRNIKALMALKGVSYEVLAELLNQKYGYDGTSRNISKKISGGTIKYLELVQILDVIGYDVKFVER